MTEILRKIMFVLFNFSLSLILSIALEFKNLRSQAVMMYNALNF